MLEKLYSRLNFVNKKRPALNETNLNHIDKAIDDIDNRVINMNESKFDKDSAKSLVKSVSLDEKTGVLTVVLYDNTTKTYNTNISKIAVNFEYDKDRQVLILILLDGTETEIDLADLVTQYEFVDSSTIQFTVNADGTVSANVKNGSITEAHLQTDYLANIKVETANSAQNREVAEASAILAKDYAEQAKESAEQALSTTPEGYNQMVSDVDLLKNAIVQTSERTLYGSKEGGIKLIGIGGASEQKQYSGKNLLQPTLKTTTANGVTITNNNDGTYTLDGDGTTTTWPILQGRFTLENFVGVELKFVGDPSSEKHCYIWIPDESKAVAYSGDTFIVESGKEYQLNCQFGAKTYSNVVLKPMLTTDLTATYDDFEPYVGATQSPNPSYPQEIESVGDSGSLTIKAEGKNLARVNNFSATAQGTALDYTLINMPTGTYAIGFATSATSGSADIIFYDKDKVKITDKNINLVDFNARKSFLFTVNSDISYVRVWTNTACEFTDFQIEPNTATPYEPYRSKSITIPLSEPLRGIGEVKDEIICQDGVWGVLRNVTKFIPSATDSYGLSGTTNFAWVTATGIPTPIHPTNKNGFSSHFTMATNSELTNATVDYGFYFGNGINFRIKGFTTLDEYKNFFASNTVEFYYVNATPTFEPFADQTPFYGLESFDTVTYISTDSEVEPSIELKFGKTEGDAVTLLNYNGMKVAKIIAESNRARLDALEKSLQVV